MVQPDKIYHACPRILVLDDSPEAERLLKASPLFENVYVTRIGSGREALEKLKRIKPNLIFSNYFTKDLNAKEIYKEIKENPNLTSISDIPFILYSNGETMTDHGDDMFNLGLKEWLIWPIAEEDLTGILERYCSGGEMLTSHEALRQEVKKSEYRYRDLLENANDFIFTLDDNGRFVYLNNRFRPLTGFEKDDWLGEPFLDLIQPSHRDTAKEHYEMAHQGRARVFESSIINVTGHIRPILSFNITPILEHGRIIGSMGIGRDVTEQKMMEQEIIELKNFNESIIQSMEAGLLTMNLDEVVTSLNAGGERILGWTAKELIGKPIRDFIDSAEVDYLLSRPSAPGTLSFSRETELTVMTGRKVNIGFTTMDRVDNNQIKVGSIISFRDITQIKQMQSEVIRMDRLASLGVLASGIAHEIKNPLAGIKTMAQTCEEEFEPEDSRREYLTRIIRQVNRLDDLLKTFFAYAKPRPPDPKSQQIQSIISEVSHLVQKKMSYAGIEYRENFQPDLPDVIVDSQQMQQVMLNLILNAVDAMQDGGLLTIYAKQVRSEFVEVTIEDTGKGIHNQKLETIFDPFFTTKPDGLGLGLSIVYRIVKEHSGNIEVESEINRGTRFKVLLPTGA